ncbi:restriction endonuclease subunit S [uncultured Roseovarius sp.]|uniref:restriction endonuclease subunit S n=1 Tax=uncultured Roseovarius sp. TaxID=293344 RepID=UPI002592C603|nr:restriction endonuclease subunit S [uncultured Roseovarius sp.]
MNAERLLEVYEQISEAPDAIARLRRFVLDLAVRGRLVEQDAKDEPANQLIEEVARERAKSRAHTTKKKKASVAPVPFRGELYTLPGGWTWSPLVDLSDVTMGQSPPGSTYNISGDGVPLINGPVEFTDGPFGKTVVNQYTTEPTNFCEAGDFLICVRGSTTGRTNVAAFRACIGRGVAAVRSTFDDGFIRLFLWKSREDIIGMGRGIAFPSVSKKQLEQLAIPLPPLAEQHRIVAKVDELMALCDRLEEVRKTREETRDKLTAASLARLTAPDTTAEDFPAHANFALEALPALTTRPDQIKTLRQTILNLAVRGKLVEQDPTDEPASEFLKRIAGEKGRLVKAGEIRKQRTLPPIEDEETSFRLPTGWAWVRLGDLSQFVTSGSRDWAKFYANQGAMFVRMGNLSKDHYQLRLENIQRVNPPATGEGTRTRLEGGDILISITGDVGMLGLIPEDFGDAYINQHTAMVRPMSEMKGRYLPELFRSPFAQDQFNAPQRGIKNSFRLTDVTQFVVPLPPLAEQHRIVAKVDALMALCDRLEAALTTTDTTRTRLLEALLHEALEPSQNVMEAAE